VVSVFALIADVNYHTNKAMALLVVNKQLHVNEHGNIHANFFTVRPSHHIYILVESDFCLMSNQQFLYDRKYFVFILCYGAVIVC